MVLDLKKDLSKNQSILLLVDSSKYNDALDDLAKELSSGTLCYVTLNKTSNSLKEKFKEIKANVENMIFIDTISKTIKKTPNQENQTYYISSPSALTELSIVIGRFLKHDFNYLVFDSLNSMLVYEKGASVSRFISSLVNKIKKSNTKSVFIALKDSNEDVINESGMFVDKVIDYSGKEIQVENKIKPSKTIQEVKKNSKINKG